MKPTLILIVVILASCNRDAHRSELSVQDVSLKADSALIRADSGLSRLIEVDSLAELTVQIVTDKINQLNEDKKELEKIISDEESKPKVSAIVEYGAPKPTVDVSALLTKLREYEARIQLLERKRRYDSVFIANYISKATIEKKTVEVITPNDSSLVVEFNTQTKNGEIPLDKIDVYIVPFNKEVKKKLMQYEMYCNQKEIAQLNGKLARQYEGKYFFNDIEPGKYLIKVCCYYGNYEVVHKGKGSQLVRMNVSPPTQ